MKNIFWRTIKSFIVLTFFILLALGSSESSDVDRGNSDTPADSGGATTDDGKTTISIQQEYNVNGLKVTIGEIELRKDKVLVGITINNVTEDTLSFYPDQGNAVMGSMQLEANMFMTEGKPSGEIHPGVTKSGVIHFTTPEDEEVPREKSITLHLGDVFNKETFSAESFKETISLE